MSDSRQDDTAKGVTKSTPHMNQSKKYQYRIYIHMYTEIIKEYIYMSRNRSN